LKGAFFGNGPGKGNNPGGGMRKIESTASLASMDSANAVGNMGTSDLQSLSTMSLEGTSIVSDSKWGKIVPQNAREGALLLIRALCELGMKVWSPLLCHYWLLLWMKVDRVPQMHQYRLFHLPTRWQCRC
jgi:hypothetical protein